MVYRCVRRRRASCPRFAEINDALLESMLFIYRRRVERFSLAQRRGRFSKRTGTVRRSSRCSADSRTLYAVPHRRLDAYGADRRGRHLRPTRSGKPASAPVRREAEEARRLSAAGSYAITTTGETDPSREKTTNRCLSNVRSTSLQTESHVSICDVEGCGFITNRTLVYDEVRSKLVSLKTRSSIVIII